MNEAALAGLVRTLQHDLQRLQSLRAIENLMGRYTVNWVPQHLHQAVQFYALGRPDVSVEVADRGVFVGAAAIRHFFAELCLTPVIPGSMLIHFLATPMIEVAGDGQTAKGVWRSPGIESVVPAGSGSPVPMWSFGAYAADFILEEGRWKIWHLHWFRTVKCTFEQGWVEDLSFTRTGRLPGSPDSLLPSTYHNPYTPDSIQESIPPCPQPYDTWTDTGWMTQVVRPPPSANTEVL